MQQHKIFCHEDAKVRRIKIKQEGQMQMGFSFVLIRVIRGSRFLVPALLGWIQKKRLKPRTDVAYYDMSWREIA